MHIRRGDFAKEKSTRDYHGLLEYPYYSRALDLLRLRTQNIDVVSDDFQNAKALINELGIKSKHSFTLRADLKDEITTLALFVMSKQIITANSSFSWWGAYLSSDAQIVAPRNYFSNSILRLNNVCDLYPEGWILV